MSRFIAAYIGAAVAFVILDAIWLSLTSATVYRPLLGPLLIDGVRWGPAVTFYLIYFAGITIFAIEPAFNSGSLVMAGRRGAAFGFTAYATYDLTNQATLITWPVQITVMDLVWGTFVTAAGAAAGFLASYRLRP